MIKRSWLTDANATILEAEIARFFEVASADQIPHLAHAAKKVNYENISPVQLAWLYRVRQVAREMVVPNYSEKRLRDALARLRMMMVDPLDAREVPQILNACGTRFVIVEGLPNAKIDGACFWLGKSPVIGMSLRFDRIDNFWFVLRHEIEHVLQRHGRDTEIVDVELEGERAGYESNSIRPEERIANRAASDFCVPIGEMDSFIARKQPFFSERDLLGFARRLQVHPGIVAGQLRRRINRWDLFAKLLVKVRDEAISAAVVDGWGQVAPVSG
jgi:HTH-type transcriptional regulator / antitoxin HigA